MTEALDKLIKAVEAGRFPSHDTLGVLGYGDEENAIRAHAGSLDAAKALHESLLPGWFLCDFGERDICGDWFAVMYPRERGDENESVTARSSIPARAWLLAILRACRAQIGGEA